MNFRYFLILFGFFLKKCFFFVYVFGRGRGGILKETSQNTVPWLSQILDKKKCENNWHNPTEKIKNFRKFVNILETQQNLWQNSRLFQLFFVDFRRSFRKFLRILTNIPSQLQIILWNMKNKIILNISKIHRRMWDCGTAGV